MSNPTYAGSPVPFHNLKSVKIIFFMLSPLDSVGEATIFVGCPSTVFVPLFVHPDRSCYCDVMNSLNNLDET